MNVAILADFPLHVIPEFAGRLQPRGHYATWLPQLCEAFASAEDLELHWIVLSREFQAPKEIEWNRQTFHILPTRPKGRALSFFRADRAAIRECLARIQPDLVHGWGFEDVYALAAACSGFRHLVSIQGLFSHYILKNRMNPRDYFQALVELFVLFKAKRMTAESAWARRVALRRVPWAHIDVVEYGVPYHFLDTPWQPDPEKPVAIFVGSVTPRKGIQDAVAAFRSARLSSAELWVVGGGGPWAAKLRETAPPNVKWLGRLSSEETARMLSRAWCFVIPTRADTGPSVVKEARVVGLPVVSTPCGGQTSYIRHGENGYLIPPGDVDGLAEALGGMLCDFARCKEMGARFHQEDRAALDPRLTAAKFLRLYAEMAGR